MSEKPSQSAQLENDIRSQIERNRSLYETSAEDPLRQIESTTLPWVVRPALRDILFDGFIDPPVGLGDNWGLQQTYKLLGNRADDLVKAIYPAETKKALGYGLEPWRENPIIPKQHRQEILEALTTPVEFGGPGKSGVQAMQEFMIFERRARERVPLLSKELMRSRGELSTVRRLIYQWWNWKNAASGQEVGQDYLDSKMAVVTRYDDMQKVFALPHTFMTKEEAVIDIKKEDGTLEKFQCPGYPEEAQIEELSSLEKLTKENKECSFGELIQREVRLMNLVALADQPEEIMKWKLQAETKKLHDILETKGVNGAYLFLKRKGINCNSVAEEVKIAEEIEKFTPEERGLVDNAFWNQFGYKNADEARPMLGYPEMWIPLKARRGAYDGVDSAKDAQAFLEIDERDGKLVDRNARKAAVLVQINLLKQCWQSLSPLNNLDFVHQQAEYTKIVKMTDEIRRLSTSKVAEEEGLVTIFPSLQLEKELKLRGTEKSVVYEGCFWARPQMAKDKTKIMEGAFMDFVGGNPLAYEEARALSDLIGFPAKWGYYARDFDPSVREQAIKEGKIKPEDPGFLPKEWQVDVEAWPYTNEVQNIMAWPWHQQYKGEAGGPDGSRGKFGPLMTDYLSAYPVEKYDDFNNKLYVVVDKNGQLKYGRSDEGVIITDTAVTLLDYWHEGGSLANPEPWGKIIEDPYRRFKLRGFFASGKTVIGGGELLGAWKKRDWKLEELDTDKFWDDYKLARRVALREELFNEDVWREVAAPVTAEYKKQAAECATRVKSAPTEEARTAEMKKGRRLYRQWRVNRKKAIFDYSDKTFGDGLVSTNMIDMAIEIRKRIPNANMAMLFGGTLDDPKLVLRRIIQKAESRGISLGWDADEITKRKSTK